MKKIFFLLPLVFVGMSALASGDGPSNNSHSLEEVIKNGQATIQHPTCHLSFFINRISGGYTNNFTQSNKTSYDWLSQSRFGSIIQGDREPVTEENKNRVTFDKIILQRLAKKGFKINEGTSRVRMHNDDAENSLEITLVVEDEVKTYNGLGDSFTSSYYSVIRTNEVKNGKVEELYSFGANSKVFKRSAFIPTTDKTIASHFDAVVEATLSNLPTCIRK